jgi:Ribonuclease toxin, BrnT, of type II toxin-antitoxin system
VAYQWDINKAATSRRKHGIDFADAVSVFSDALAITISDEHRMNDLMKKDSSQSAWTLWAEYWWWSIPYAVKKFD